MEKEAERLGIDANKMIFMGKDRRYYSDDTPLAAGLDEDNLNEIDVLEDLNASTISIRWLMKNKKPIMSVILIVSLNCLKQFYSIALLMCYIYQLHLISC